eukprot:365466-Chlamydomonas_euryale.AAC.14
MTSRRPDVDLEADRKHRISTSHAFLIPLYSPNLYAQACSKPPVDGMVLPLQGDDHVSPNVPMRGRGKQICSRQAAVHHALHHDHDSTYKPSPNSSSWKASQLLLLSHAHQAEEAEREAA